MRESVRDRADLFAFTFLRQASVSLDLLRVVQSQVREGKVMYWLVRKVTQRADATGESARRRATANAVA